MQSLERRCELLLQIDLPTVAMLLWCIHRPTLSNTAAANSDNRPSVSSRPAPLIEITHLAIAQVIPWFATKAEGSA